MNGAAVFLAAFLAFGIYQGVTAESYIDADEIYYAYYMKHISGPWSEESRDWLKEQRNEFAPMLEAQKRVNRGELSSEALLAYNSLQQNILPISVFFNPTLVTTSRRIPVRGLFMRPDTRSCSALPVQVMYKIHF